MVMYVCATRPVDEHLTLAGRKKNPPLADDISSRGASIVGSKCFAPYRCAFCLGGRPRLGNELIVSLYISVNITITMRKSYEGGCRSQRSNCLVMVGQKVGLRRHKLNADTQCVTSSPHVLNKGYELLYTAD